jgi:hypothetical protein
MKAVPVYLPSLVLIQALLMAWLTGSGFQYEDWPWTLILMLPAAVLLLISFVLLITRNLWSLILILGGFLLSLPYLLPSYFSILLELIRGKPSTLFPILVLSTVFLLMAFTVHKALGLMDSIEKSGQ